MTNVKYGTDLFIHKDSRGKTIKVGDPVKFRGGIYTIKSFLFTKGPMGSRQIEFEEEQHTPEIAEETSVDLI